MKIFTFVRNPWDRLVSAFFYLDKGGGNSSDEKDRIKYIAKYKGDFNKFVEKEYSKKRIFKQLHFKPQHSWINDKNKIIVDYVGKMENFNNDFKNICRRIGKKYKIIKKTNNSNHFYYKNYYNTLTKDLVHKMYKKDIEMFNYNF